MLGRQAFASSGEAGNGGKPHGSRRGVNFGFIADVITGVGSDASGVVEKCAQK